MRSSEVHRRHARRYCVSRSKDSRVRNQDRNPHADMWQRHDQIAIAGTRGSVNPGRRMRVLARNRTGSTEQKGREQMSPKEMAMLRERLERVRREYGAAWRDTLVLQTHMF